MFDDNVMLIYYILVADLFFPSPDKIDQFDPFNLEIILQVIRGKEVIYEGKQNTSQMRRKTEIMDYLFRGSTIPAGSVAFTGTGIPPIPEPGLQHGDVVLVDPAQRMF